MTLQDQYTQINEGKGAKDVFLKHAKKLFPNMIPNHYGYEDSVKILKQRSVITENIWGIANASNKQPDWFQIFNENLNEYDKASNWDNESIILNKSAPINPSILKPSTNFAHNAIIAAFMTNINKPRVKTVNGKVNKTNIGFTKTFNNPKTIATIIADFTPST